MLEAGVGLLGTREGDVAMSCFLNCFLIPGGEFVGWEELK